MTEHSQQLTVLLAKWGQGDREALDVLMPLVYNELRKLAKLYLRRERAGHIQKLLPPSAKHFPR